MLRKMFRERPPQQWKIVEKDMVDEIIFRTMKPRNRIMLELMGSDSTIEPKQVRMAITGMPVFRPSMLALIYIVVVAVKMAIT
jgi:hypothetical protein